MLWLGGYVREGDVRVWLDRVGWVRWMDGWMDNKAMRIRLACSGSRCFGYLSGSCGGRF